MSNKKKANTEEFWDSLYTERERIWSGNPNAPLLKATKTLQPGTALDLGCGEGGDAVWLALHGWKVTATDISSVALERTESLADEHKVTKQIVLKQHDFEKDFPEGTYDLVSAQYLQSPLAFERQKVLQKAAEAVAPNGMLLIVEHASAPSWSEHKKVDFPTAEQTLVSLQLDPKKWSVKQAEKVERDTKSPDGKPATIADNVIIAHRTAE